MYRQIIVGAEATIPVPQELRGHTIEVEIKDLDADDKISPGKRVFHTVEEVHAHFNAVSIDTRGWEFDREEANRRR